MGIDETLAQRGGMYGEFSKHAEISQNIKFAMQNTVGWGNLNKAKKEALEMVAHKIARILNGDSNVKDSWHGIIRYATLIEKTL